MNLNLVFIIGCLICGTLVSAQGSSEITRLLGNQQIVGKQIMCVLDKGPCDQLGNQLKGNSVSLSLAVRSRSIFFARKSHFIFFFSTF